MAAKGIDFWFDFASTYSYPAMMRIEALAKAADVPVRFRPFLLGPIFKAQGWATSPFNLYPAKGHNMWRDLERLCADLGAAVPPPRCLSAEQPDGGPRRARRPGRRMGRGVLARGVPGGVRRRPRIADPVTLGEILTGLRIDPQAALAAAQSDAIKARLRSQTEEAQKLGIFGAPTFITPTANCSGATTGWSGRSLGDG